MSDPATVRTGARLDLTLDLPVSLGARPDRTVPRVVPSKAGADAPIRGAASLAVSRVFSPSEAAPGPWGRRTGPDLLARRLEKAAR